MASLLQTPRENFRATRAFLIVFLTMVLISVSAGMVQIITIRYSPYVPILDQLNELIGVEMFGTATLIAILASVPASFYAVAVSLVFSHCRWSRRLGLAMTFSCGLTVVSVLLVYGVFREFADARRTLLSFGIPCLLGAIGSTWVVWRFYKIVER